MGGVADSGVLDIQGAPYDAAKKLRQLHTQTLSMCDNNVYMDWLLEKLGGTETDVVRLPTG